MLCISQIPKCVQESVEVENLRQLAQEADAMRSRHKFSQEDAAQKQSELMEALETVQGRYAGLSDKHAHTARQLSVASSLKFENEEKLRTAESAQT